LIGNIGAMPRITISYRREDSLDIAGRIFDRLAGHFGRGAVFLDIDAIPPGADFRRHVDRVLDESDIVLAIIGPRWIGPDDAQRRLASPADPVRLEIETALKLNRPLIPVLVSRAVMPRPDELPESLRDFAYHNAVQVDSGVDFDVHVSRLIRGMEQMLRIGEDAAADQTRQGVTAAIEAEPPVASAPKPETPAVAAVQSVDWPGRANVGHAIRWAIGLALVAMLGIIGAGVWWVFLERPAETAVEDALKNGKAAQDRQDYGEAMRSYRMAADQGNADAQVYVGNLFYLGQGTVQDYPEALRWYRKAADRGNADAEFSIGLLYEYGLGVPEDYAEATRWYRKAADQGNAFAKSRLEALTH
jgi:tetratricopeptide (TPR) repeat protein